MDDPAPNYNYKYYLLGDSVPVQVVFNARGHKVGACVPDRETRSLKIAHEYMSRIEISYEVDEIDAATFEALCQRYYDR